MTETPPNNTSNNAPNGASSTSSSTSSSSSSNSASRTTPGSTPAAFLPAFLAAITRPPQASRGRFILAMCVALTADLLFWWLGEALPVVSDFAVAFILALCLGGFSVELLAACIAEATPGVGLLPAWSVAVPILWARANAARQAREATAPTRAP